MIDDDIEFLFDLQEDIAYLETRIRASFVLDLEERLKRTATLHTQLLALREAQDRYAERVSLRAV